MLITDKQDIREELGEDLWLLIQGFELPLVEVDRVTTLFSNYLQRDSFKLRLANGRILKARRFPNAYEAERVTRLSQYLNPEHFPRVLASNRTGLLIEWIEGIPLNSNEYDSDIFTRAGTIQGALHSTSLPDEVYEQSHSEIHFWRIRLKKKIQYLIDKNSLTETEGNKLLNLAKINSSNNFSVGLTHGDYCTENMILDKTGRPHIIDIETICVTAFAYDLARTTYRWPMSSEHRQAYLSGYSKFRKPDDFLRNLSFWIILVLVESAEFRTKGQMTSINEPLRKIKEVLDYKNGEFTI